jgi:hypothetical protein
MTAHLGIEEADRAQAERGLLLEPPHYPRADDPRSHHQRRSHQQATRSSATLDQAQSRADAAQQRDGQHPEAQSNRARGRRAGERADRDREHRADRARGDGARACIERSNRELLTEAPPRVQQERRRNRERGNGQGIRSVRGRSIEQHGQHRRQDGENIDQLPQPRPQRGITQRSHRKRTPTPQRPAGSELVRAGPAVIRRPCGGHSISPVARLLKILVRVSAARIGRRKCWRRPCQARPPLRPSGMPPKTTRRPCRHRKAPASVISTSAFTRDHLSLPSAPGIVEAPGQLGE